VLQTGGDVYEREAELLRELCELARELCVQLWAVSASRSAQAIRPPDLHGALRVLQFSSARVHIVSARADAHLRRDVWPALRRTVNHPVRAERAEARLCLRCVKEVERLETCARACVREREELRAGLCAEGGMYGTPEHAGRAGDDHAHGCDRE
jgi:hypothetical protein